jgi:phosphoribosylanthranilate isomerase
MMAARDFPFIVKVCGITNEEDARTAVEAGASALGFNFYIKSPRYIQPTHARQIASTLPSFVLKVGVFVNPLLEQLITIANEVGLDVLQMHGESRVPEVSRSAHNDHGLDAPPTGLTSSFLFGGAESVLCTLPTRYRIWQAMTAGEPAPCANERIEAYLLDAPALDYGGSGKVFNWRLATGFPYRAIIAGGLDASNIAEAIQTALPYGVDACSRLESSPGRKDAQRVRDFVRAAVAASRLIQELTL